jgi:hypothetical protein
MKFITDPIVKTAKDAVTLSGRMLEDGVEFLHASIGKIPLFAGTKVYVAEDGFSSDETHYFLVPSRAAERGYALATTRVLPEGVGPENDLPKRRVFHLPAGVSEESLEELLEDQLTRKNRASAGEGSGVADRIDEIAGEIDKKSNMVTGGLLLIGGAVAIANPVVGAGIAAKALLPGLGGVLSKFGAKALTDTLRSRKRAKLDATAERDAEREVKRLKAEVHSNTMLSVLEEAVSTDDPDHDPAMTRLHADTPAEMRVMAITAGAVGEVYAELLKTWPKEAEEANLHRADHEWLRSLEGLG